MRNKVKLVLFLVCIILFSPLKIEARRGCCSHHGGVSGCSSSGRQVCNDGTLSPTCTCTPTITYTYGCTDKEAMNYNSKANKDDGSCVYYVFGCTDKTAKNYDEKANKDNGSCEYYVYGCTNSSAVNYNSKAEKDDGSCIIPINSDELENTVDSNTKEKNENDGLLNTVIGICVIFGCLYLYNKKIKRKY